MKQLFVIALVAACTSPSVPAKPKFQQDVAPILDANCVRCHGAPVTSTALLATTAPCVRLDRWDTTPDTAMACSDSVNGGMIFGAHDASTVLTSPVDLVDEVVQGRMPKDGPPLTDQQIEILTHWRDDGYQTSGTNLPPTIQFVTPPASGVTLCNPSCLYGVQYVVGDPDGDVVGQRQDGHARDRAQGRHRHGDDRCQPDPLGHLHADREPRRRPGPGLGRRRRQAHRAVGPQRGADGERAGSDGRRVVLPGRRDHDHVDRQRRRRRDAELQRRRAARHDDDDDQVGDRVDRRASDVDDLDGAVGVRADQLHDPGHLRRRRHPSAVGDRPVGRVHHQPAAAAGQLLDAVAADLQHDLHELVVPRQRDDAGRRLDAGVGASYAALVNVASKENPCTSYKFVLPGQPDQSYLIFKLQGSGACFTGSQMPKGKPVLSSTQIQLFRDWIANNASNN